MRRALILVLLFAAFVGVVGFLAGVLTSKKAQDSDSAGWVIVQYDQTGAPARCWRQNAVELNPESGGLTVSNPLITMHLVGTYAARRVSDDHWDEAYRALGVSDEASCSQLGGRTWSRDGGWERLP